MISRTYKELLPAYLDGSNIRKHAGIIEAQDKLVDDKIEYLSQWNLLERPILIEYQATSHQYNINENVNINYNMILHINTQQPIQQITVTGDITDTITFNDDITTNYTKQYNNNTKNTDLIYYTANGTISTDILPQIIVTVHTIDGKEYKKGYPENDEKQDNIYDHDEFLDKIGSSMGLPRRKHKQFWSYNNPSYFTMSYSVPPYFAKKAVKYMSANEFLFLECTEDDYYYMQRINTLMNSKTSLDIIKTIYGSTAHFITRDYAIPPTVDGQNINIAITLADGYDNGVGRFNIDLDSMNQLYEPFLPVTRNVYVYPSGRLGCWVDRRGYYLYFDAYPNYVHVHFTVQYIYLSGNPVIMYLPVRLQYIYANTNGTVFLESPVVYSDSNGVVDYSRGGFPARMLGIRPVFAESFQEFTQLFVNIVGRDISSVFALSLDAWDYVKLSSTSVSDESLVLPSLDGNSYLSMGHGYLTYTPAIDFSLVDVSAYTLLISFHAGGENERIGLVEVNTTNGSVSGEWVVLDDYLTNYSYDTTHTLAYRFLDGVAYVYLDGVYTGLYKDYSSYTEGMLYVAGYNPNDVTGNGGLYIGSVSVDNTAGISTAPSTIVRHDVNINVPDTTTTLGDTASILATLLDENNDNVTDGVLDWTVYPEHDITLDINDWSYAKMNGTTVPYASLIAPTVANGELSTGRGNVVYYDTALPSDLSEYTLRVKCHGTRRYNRLGIGTITTNNDSTISIDISKVGLLGDLVGSQNDNTSYEVEFKFLDGICYIYLDGTYTGLIRDYSSVSDDLYLVAYSNGQYNNRVTPIVIESLSYVDCVDLNTVPTGGGQ